MVIFQFVMLVYQRVKLRWFGAMKKNFVDPNTVPDPSLRTVTGFFGLRSTKKDLCLFTETQQLSFQWERWWYSSWILSTPFWDWNPNLFDSTYLNSSWQVCYNVIINAHARTHQKSWLLWLDEIRWELNANGILQRTRVYADRQQEVLLLKFDFKVGAIINRFNTWLLLTALSLFHSSQHHPQGC